MGYSFDRGAGSHFYRRYPTVPVASSPPDEQGVHMPRAEVLTEVSEAARAVVPARSVRRATARRASHRRATARRRQGDTEARIIYYLAEHPESTVGDLAKRLNLNPASVATRLAQLANAGAIKKASHGYSTDQTSL
jgi:Winged helix-turn-helix DNA-binding